VTSPPGRARLSIKPASERRTAKLGGLEKGLVDLGTIFIRGLDQVQGCSALRQPVVRNQRIRSRHVISRHVRG
jgi:hypothetical protein